MNPLESFLLGGSRTVPAAAVLRESGLGAYAYAALPAEHPLRAGLRADFLGAIGRHYEIRRELAPLLAAWHDAGIEALLIKGFHLSEFVYPAPGIRFHGDVDVVVRPEDAREAVRIALSRGWVGEWNSFEMGRAYSHGVCNLRRAGGATQVDLQRFVVHSRTPVHPAQRRVTEAVWSRSRLVEWEGTRVRLPHPVDALLVLALQRCWGDRWGLKAQDALDVRYLSERAGAGWRAEIRERAAALGCARTLEIFLRRCDPDRGRLVLAAPTRAEQRRWNLAVVRERPLLWAERWTARLALLPAAAVDVPVGLWRLLRARRALRRYADIPRLLASLTPARGPRAPGAWGRRARSVLGIRWAMRLLPRGADGPCLVRSLAVYSALRSQGWPVEFVSGVRRHAGGVTGHAWVELEGEVLPELAEPHNARMFAVNVRYPGVSG
jgi:hypothetical protein